MFAHLTKSTGPATGRQRVLTYSGFGTVVVSMVLMVLVQAATGYADPQIPVVKLITATLLGLAGVVALVTSMARGQKLSGDYVGAAWVAGGIALVWFITTTVNALTT